MEVAGIEPASSAASTGLLRAQCALSSSAPPILHTSRCDGPSHCELSRPHPRPAGTVSHLADASDRGGDEPGLTDLLRLLLGSESEVSAIGIGAYFFVHRFFSEVSNAVLGPLPLSRRPESRPFTPIGLTVPPA